jgi:mRNA-degrading endonuclease toxin of MazEF toxin-antitoxin module
MPLPRPEPGLVLSYAYLWRHEHNRGREEGIKARPCAVVLASRDAAGRTVVAVAPITHRAPADPARAIPLPPTVKRHLRLDRAASWIVADEVNRFLWPGPDLRPISRREPDRFAYGFLPEDVFDRLRERMIALHRTGEVTTTPRMP